MDLNNLTLFKMVGKRMDWVAQRQAVLASNIANVDTPEFLPTEVKEIDFSKELKKSSVHMEITNPMHISNDMNVSVGLARTNFYHLSPVGSGNFREYEVKKPYETSIDDNGVVLEEQLEKLSKNRQLHNIATTIYKKNVNMIGATLGKNMK